MTSTFSKRLLFLIVACLLYLTGMRYAILNLNYSLAYNLVYLPAGLMGLYMAVFHFRQFLMLMVFTIPASISIKNLGGGFGASFPIEAMLALSALIAGISLITKPWLDKRVLRHPVTIVIAIQILWIIISTFFSSYTLVSSKFLLARISYVLVFYLVFISLFKERSQIGRFFWMYLLGLVPVMLSSIKVLSKLGFARQFSPEMARPYFDDHTVFGACIAMIIPVTFIFFRRRKQYMEAIRGSRLIFFIAPLAVISLFLSFSRAAWLSIILAGFVYIAMRFKVKFRVFLITLLIIGGLGYVYQGNIVEKMQSNENVSGRDLLATAKSVTNVSSDESNMERVNRWSCAIRMFQDRPLIGFGPGTYERNYGPYQSLNLKTRISTTEGDRGDAHSEYLGALSEQGLPGMLILIVLMLTVLHTGMRVAYQAESKEIRTLAMLIMLGLFTYYVHGGVNSFLDIEKAATLFWAMSGMLVAMDIYHIKE